MNLILKNQPAERERLHDAFHDFGSRHAIPDRVLLRVSLALEELFTNIISYGYEDQGEHTIEASFSLDQGKLVIRLSDDGRAFDPTQHPLPDLGLSLDEKPIGGLGIYMARRSLDRLEYFREDGRNVLVLTKTLPEEVKSS